MGPSQELYRQAGISVEAVPPADELTAEGSPGLRWAQTVDTYFGLFVEIPAALLVVVGDRPCCSPAWSLVMCWTAPPWSDELVSILFLWLAMLGFVVALRRGEHMRMTALVAVSRPRPRAVLDVVAMAVPLAFLR